MRSENKFESPLKEIFMQRGNREISFGGMLIAMLLIINAIVLSQALISGSHWYGWLLVTIPVMLFVIIDIRRKAGN